MVAETFVVAWRRLENLPPPRERIYWLYGIARRVLANQRRGVARRLRLRDKLRALPAPRERSGSDLPDVMTAMSHLSPASQEVLRLVAWEGLSHAEIGLVLGISANAAAIRLHRARGQLERELRGPADDELKGLRRIRTLVGWKGSASRRSHREEVP